MSHDVFISYSADDKTVADATCAILERNGIRCWIAPRDVIVGKDWSEAIVDAIHGARAFVLIFSRNANESPQVKREVERAVSLGLPVVPVRIDDVQPSKALEYFISTPHWMDAITPPIERHLEILATSIKALLWPERSPDVDVEPHVAPRSQRDAHAESQPPPSGIKPSSPRVVPVKWMILGGAGLVIAASVAVAVSIGHGSSVAARGGIAGAVAALKAPERKDKPEPKSIEQAPTAAEWGKVNEVEVKGSSMLRCETKIVREWFRVLCRGPRKTGGMPVNVVVVQGAGKDVLTSASPGVTSLVMPYKQGTELVARFSWTDGSYQLVVRWPSDSASRPVVVGQFDEISPEQTHGQNVVQPSLAPDDEGFVDTRGGWGWGDRCWLHFKAGKLGWAKAACLQAMALDPATPNPKASLLYNLGRIEQSAGNMDVARQYFEQSLALREHPAVRAALDSLP